MYCSLFCFVLHSKCLVSSLIHHHNKPWFHPVFNTNVSVLCYECIWRWKLHRQGWKGTSSCLSASVGCKCTVPGWKRHSSTRSKYQCHNSTVQFQNDSIVHKQRFPVSQCNRPGQKVYRSYKVQRCILTRTVSFHTGSEPPIERFGTDDRRVESADR